MMLNKLCRTLYVVYTTVCLRRSMVRNTIRYYSPKDSFQLIPWDRVLEQLRVVQLFKNILTFFLLEEPIYSDSQYLSLSRVT